MRTLCVIRAAACAAALALLGTGLSAAQDKPEEKIQLRSSAECSPRGGLPNFFAKCEKGGTVKVAYFGGSITSQAGWRVQSLDFLRKMFPGAKLEEINAAIGGGTSKAGIFRLEKDCLNQKPDLLFIEFSINDTTLKPEDIRRGMEGIVRAVWQALPGCDICFVYTVTISNVKLLQEGKVNMPTTLHEEIADRYGIPSINMSMEIARLEKEGKLQMKAPQAVVERVDGKELDTAAGARVNPDGKIPFALDGVHPYLDTGHKLYTDAIIRSLPAIKAASAKPAPHSELPPPLNQNYIRHVSFFSPDKALMSGAWERVDNPAKTFKNGNLEKIVPLAWKAAPGSVLSFNFKGRSCMLMTMRGPESGFVEVIFDGQALPKYNFFDAYSTYWHLDPFFSADGLDPEKTHSLSLKVLPDTFDKRALLAKYHREKPYDDNPETYKQANFVISGIFIEDGEIVSGNE